MLIEVVCRIGKGREDQYLPVPRVDGMRLLLTDQGEQLLQFGIVCGRYIADELGKQL